MPHAGSRMRRDLSFWWKSVARVARSIRLSPLPSRLREGLGVGFSVVESGSVGTEAPPPDSSRKREGSKGSLHFCPFGAQRLHDRRFDEAFDTRARGVVGAELGAFRRGQRLFEEGAQDRRFDAAPLFCRSIDEVSDLVASERINVGIFEQAAVEIADLAA